MPLHKDTLHHPIDATEEPSTDGGKEVRVEQGGEEGGERVKGGVSGHGESRGRAEQGKMRE